MSRGPRLDAPGQIFHVMNRGTARRTMFERAEDIRYFLSRLAHCVRRGQFDVLSYSVLSTHFHLVLRSHGHLSAGMRRVQSEYTQHFNRSRGRDGALQRGRFHSKPVTSELYLANLIPYVDENPVDAGLAELALDYPWGSAHAWVNGLHRQWLADDLAHLSHPSMQVETRRARAAFIEARLAGSGAANPYEDLIGAVPQHIAVRMRERAELADGTAPGLPVAGVPTVEGEIKATPAGRTGARILVPGGKRQDTAALLRAGLLRELAGLSFARVARTLETTETRAKRLYVHHLRCLRHDAEYRSCAARVVARCLERLAVPGNR